MQAQLQRPDGFTVGAARSVVGITPKGPSKSSVAIQRERLPDAEAVTEMRTLWKERLAALADLLAG